MITYKIVNRVAITILIIIFSCENCFSIDVTDNVHFIKPLSKNLEPEETKKDDNVITPKLLSKFLTLWDTIEDQKAKSGENDIRDEDSNRNLNSMEDKKRIIRQITNGYSSIYPALSTMPYRPPAGPNYGTAQYSTHNNYSGSNQTFSPNTTMRYPSYNSVSSRPPYFPPKQNFSYVNPNSFNQNLNPYNQPRYPNNFSAQNNVNVSPHNNATYHQYNNYQNVSVHSVNHKYTTPRQPYYPTFVPNNNWPPAGSSNKPLYNNYNITKQITNQTIHNPQYNPLGNFILNGYQSNYTHYNSNSAIRRPTFSPNNTSINMFYNSTRTPWYNKSVPSVPGYGNNTLNRQTNYSQRYNNSYQYRPQQGLALNGLSSNYPSYNSPNASYNNLFNAPYQGTPVNLQNYSSFNNPPREPRPNDSVSRNPYNQTSTFNKGNHNNWNQWSYNQSLNKNSSYNPINGLSNGPQLPNNSVNNSSYPKQWPYYPPSTTPRTDIQNGMQYNNAPNQYNYMEPNHFFYTPGNNLPTYNPNRNPAQTLSYR